MRFSLCSRILATASDKSKRSDEKDNVESISVSESLRANFDRWTTLSSQTESVAPEAQIHAHVDQNSPLNNQNEAKVAPPEPIKDEENIEELNDSLQDFIIQYRIQEQQKQATVNEDDDDDDDGDEGDEDDVNLQRILNQISVSLRKKYVQKENSEQPSTKLSAMIQQLYQTLKKTQPELFAKRSASSADGANTDQAFPGDTATPSSSMNEELLETDDVDDAQEEILPLTPEMEHANTLYHQAMKLINVTMNRQYDT